MIKCGNHKLIVCKHVPHVGNERHTNKLTRCTNRLDFCGIRKWLEAKIWSFLLSDTLVKLCTGLFVYPGGQMGGSIPVRELKTKWWVYPPILWATSGHGWPSHMDALWPRCPLPHGPPVGYQSHGRLPVTWATSGPSTMQLQLRQNFKYTFTSNKTNNKYQKWNIFIQ